jgi:hypothetical protein
VAAVVLVAEAEQFAQPEAVVAPVVAAEQFALPEVAAVVLVAQVERYARPVVVALRSVGSVVALVRHSAQPAAD